MSTFDLVVVWLNMTGAVAAVAANWWAARHADPRKRPLWAAVAVLAAVYAGSYLWLVVEGDVVVWSKIMRGVSLIVWPLVWVSAPVLSVLLFRRDRQAIQRKADEALP